jgi:SAM-dependent methyltransferase
LARSFLRRLAGRLRGEARTQRDGGGGGAYPAQGVRPPAALEEPVTEYRRFVGARMGAEESLLAAREYVAAMKGFELEWLRRKPFDPRPGNAQFFLQLSSLLNLLQAMDLPGEARVLEVGSGPGWVTEILMLLGHSVDAVEPSSAMAAFARERIASARQHYHVGPHPSVELHVTSMEAVSLPEGVFDGVIFHDALHHLVDEEVALGRCFTALRPGGVLGVSEDAWRPGDREQETALEAEMARFGTLEKPFTQAYLDALLTRVGFMAVERYHAVNGYFPVELGGATLEALAHAHASRTNNLTARKPWAHPTTADPDAETRAVIEVLSCRFEPADRRLSLTVRLTNTGGSVWLRRPARRGWVAIAVRSARAGGVHAAEARPRHRLPQELAPGATLELTLDFFLPEGHENQAWSLDLVNEGLFWFSEGETRAVDVGPPRG